MQSTMRRVLGRRTQLGSLRPRVVSAAVLCAQVTALVCLKSGLGLRLSLAVAASAAVLMLTRDALYRWIGASWMLLRRWRDSRFQSGLRTALLLLTACAVMTFLSKLLYEAVYRHAHVSGRVTYEETGQPAPSVVVRAQSIRDELRHG
jgi:hypothetical protein